MLRKVTQLFSVVKVSIESVKRLREETSAPMGECKRALEESQGEHEKALQWLRKKGLLAFEKRADRDTREGVIAAYITPCRSKALLLEVNCETDFVAKSELFLKFVDGLGNSLLYRDEPVEVDGTTEDTKGKVDELLNASPAANLFPEDPAIISLAEEHKLVVARLQENVRIRRVVSLHSDGCRYGSYVHRPYKDGVGLQACVVELQISSETQITPQSEEVIDEFADDMATQVLGSPPKYLNFQEIPAEEIQAEAEKARTQMAPRLQKAPEHTHQAMISGKLMSSYYSQVLLGCMPYLLSNQGKQVSEYWTEVEHQTGCSIAITRALSWQCKSS